MGLWTCTTTACHTVHVCNTVHAAAQFLQYIQSRHLNHYVSDKSKSHKRIPVVRLMPLAAVTMLTAIYWDVTPCSLVLSTEVLNLITTLILRLYGKLQTLNVVVSDFSLALTVKILVRPH